MTPHNDPTQLNDDTFSLVHPSFHHIFQNQPSHDFIIYPQAGGIWETRCGCQLVATEFQFVNYYHWEVEQVNWKEKVIRFLKFAPIAILLKSDDVLAATEMTIKAMESAQKIRDGFNVLLSVGTAIAEPILWLFGLRGAIYLARSQNWHDGWQRLKAVGCAYLAVCLLPTGFQMVHWIAQIIREAIQM